MIQSIENTKLNCVKLYRETHRLTEEIKSLKKVLNDQLERFDRFDADEKKGGGKV